MADLDLERATGADLVAGIDEVGRGPWAGPVVAAAVVLRPEAPVALIAALDDSKKLSRERRLALRRDLATACWVGIAGVGPREIERLGLGKALDQAMALALAALPTMPGHVLVDGKRTPPLPVPATAIVKGDSKSASIAAASIIAKCARDDAMVRLDRRYPGYGWATNVGYGAAAHREALLRLGPAPPHRRNFKPVAALVNTGECG